MKNYRVCCTSDGEKIRSQSKLLLEDINNEIEKFKKNGDITTIDNIIYMLIKIKCLEKREV